MHAHPTRRRFLGAAGLAAFQVAQGLEPARPRIRIGQIGSRHAHAAGKLQAILKQPETFEFVGCVEPDPKRAQSLRKRAPWKDVPWMTEPQLLAAPGLQAVAVETEIESLVPTGLRCLQAGLHIHLDKPAGTSLAACRELHAEAARQERTVQMGYMFRYNPAFEFLFRVVRDGWLGEITEVNGMIGKKMPDAGRRELARFEGGGMFELACHLIDAAITVIGPPDRVTGFNHHTDPGRDRFADNQLAVLEAGSAIATIRCNHVDPLGSVRRQFGVTGTLGTCEIRPLEPPALRLGLDRPRGGFVKGFQDVPLPRASGRYDGEFLDLARVIRGDKKLAWDAAHDLAVHEAVLRAGGMPVSP